MEELTPLATLEFKTDEGTGTVVMERTETQVFVTASYGEAKITHQPLKDLMILFKGTTEAVQHVASQFAEAAGTRGPEPGEGVPDAGRDAVPGGERLGPRLYVPDGGPAPPSIPL